MPKHERPEDRLSHEGGETTELRVGSAEQEEMLTSEEGRHERVLARGAEIAQAERVRGRLRASESSQGPFDQKRIDAYVARHLPERFRTSSAGGQLHQYIAKTIFGALEKLGVCRIEGREHVPSTGACVLMSNHTRFFDEARLLALLGRPAHILAADMHFDANPLQKKFMELIGAIEVQSTLSHLSAEEKAELMERVPKGAKAYYQKVIDRDADAAKAKGIGAQRDMLRSTVAALIHGDPVIVFPEGLWLYEPGNTMRKAYSGIELIAREYRRVTGRDLPIIPTAITEGRVTAGEAVVLEPGQTVHDIMQKIAALLPEAERGYYGDERQS